MRLSILATAVLLLSCNTINADDKITCWDDDKTCAHADQCGPGTVSARNSADIKDPEDGSAYNRLANGLVPDTIENGYIIAFEKASRNDISVDDTFERQRLKDFEHSATLSRAKANSRNARLSSIMNDSHPIYVSHINRFEDRASCAIHNRFNRGTLCEGSERRTGTKIAQDGLDALEKNFADDLQASINSGKYSHIVFAAMGWNNDQRVSICRYNEIHARTAKHMPAGFKPLIIGLTWPSAWFAGTGNIVQEKLGHFSSVFNKANDSDEVGYLYGNLILNRIIPTANAQQSLPVIALGHSYGARVIGGSIYNRDILRDGPIGDGPDLFVSLLPAHSARRFTRSGGAEGNPYYQSSAKVRVVAVRSDKDKANPIAFWSTHLGGHAQPWYKKLFSSPIDDQFDVIDAAPVDAAIRKLNVAIGRPTVIDGTEFVFSHNDIMSDDMGKLIAALIRRYAR